MLVQIVVLLILPVISPAKASSDTWAEVNMSDGIANFTIYGPKAEILYNSLTTKEVEVYGDQYSLLMKKPGKNIVCFHDVTVYYYCDLKINPSGEILESK